MKKIDVLVFGRACVDYIAVVNEFPNEDEKVPFEYKLKEAGGQGSTSSCCISKLGGKVIYIGTIGDDNEGEFCIKRLKDFNVDPDHIITKKGNTPIAYIFITKSNGKRTIIFEPYNLPEMEIDDKISSIIENTNTILLDPQVTYLGKYFRKAKKRNYKIVYDCERWKDGIKDIMETADFFIPSSIFLNNSDRFKGTLIDRIHELNKMIAGTLIVTDGENGAFYIIDNNIYHILPPKIQVKDTIGAGDNFHGAFAYAAAKGFDLQQSVKFSISTASLSCREYGGRNGLPGIDEVLTIADTLETVKIG